MSVTNKEIVQMANDAFRNNDMEMFLSYCADDVSWTMVGSAALTGKNNILESMKDMEFTGTPEITVNNIIAEGDHAACEGTMVMNKRSGGKFHGAFCDTYLFKDGIIRELKSYVVETKQ